MLFGKISRATELDNMLELVERTINSINGLFGELLYIIINNISVL